VFNAELDDVDCSFWYSKYKDKTMIPESETIPNANITLLTVSDLVS